MQATFAAALWARRRFTEAAPTRHLIKKETYPMPDPATMQEIDQHIVEHLDETLHDLAVLCRQPSVAAQHYGIEDCAELLAAMLKSSGFTVQILPTGGSPVVIAD